jgi:hypothetical protein
MAPVLIVLLISAAVVAASMLVRPVRRWVRFG